MPFPATFFTWVLQRSLCKSIILWTKIGCSAYYERLMIHSQIVYIITIKQKKNLFDRLIKSNCSRSYLSFLLDWLSRQPQKWKCWYTNRMYIDCGIVYTMVLELQPFNNLWYYSIHLVCSLVKFCHHIVFIVESSDSNSTNIW